MLYSAYCVVRYVTVVHVLVILSVNIFRLKTFEVAKPIPDVPSPVKLFDVDVYHETLMADLPFLLNKTK